MIQSRCFHLNTKKNKKQKQTNKPKQNKKKTLLLAGAHDRTKQEKTDQYFEVSQLYIHKRYQTISGYGHDIGLIRLSRPAVLNKTVGLVCLPEQDNRVAVNTLCYLTGNGVFSSIIFLLPNSDRSRLLVETGAYISSKKTCRQSKEKLLTRSYNYFVEVNVKIHNNINTDTRRAETYNRRTCL